MEKFLELMLNQCLDILESDSGSVLLLDKNNRDIVVRVARGRHKTSILGERLRVGEGISGWVAQQRRPLLVEDVSKEERIKERCRIGNYRTNSFLSVPLMSAGRLLGVVNITEKTDGNPFSIKELSFISALSAAASQTIDKMLYCEHLERQLACFKNSTAVTQFTSAIAHELNNPLDGILRYTQLCMMQVPEHSALREYLLEIQSGLKRMAGIVRSMLEFSFAGDKTRSPVTREQIDVNSILRKTVAFFEPHTHYRRVKIELDLSEPLPLVRDCGLQQVFKNIIKNALDSIGEEGKLLIRDYEKDGSLCFEFVDTGRGVDEGIREKIFEPFFSTKPDGKGLGLAITKEIINCYSGTIALKNMPQGGAQCTVAIPLGGAHENAYSYK
ncbi:MAG: GAF domain-containing sensor histidine kinase [Candidatus Omnitrophica bacterium]|nr:GAF domain-containing sensor histidine kinase [Candidatus Omnitrophota bacterium]